MTNLLIFTLTLMSDNLMEVRYVAPWAGRITADVKCSLSDPWHTGWANKPTPSGTNVFVMKRPCAKDGFVRLFLQPE